MENKLLMLTKTRSESNATISHEARIQPRGFFFKKTDSVTPRLKIEKLSVTAPFGRRKVPSQNLGSSRKRKAEWLCELHYHVIKDFVLHEAFAGSEMKTYCV
jgi:hypothetical protein